MHESHNRGRGVGLVTRCVWDSLVTSRLNEGGFTKVERQTYVSSNHLQLPFAQSNKAVSVPLIHRLRLAPSLPPHHTTYMSRHLHAAHTTTKQAFDPHICPCCRWTRDQWRLLSWVQWLAGQAESAGGFYPSWSHQPGSKKLLWSRLVAPTGTKRPNLLVPGGTTTRD